MRYNMSKNIKYHLLSRDPLLVLPLNRCLGIFVPTNLSLSLLLSWVLQTFVSLLVSLLPLISGSESYLWNPLLLLLEDSLILFLIFIGPYSSSSIMSFATYLLPLTYWRDFDRLRFLILSSTNDESMLFYSRIYLNLSILLFFSWAVLFLFKACSSLKACFFFLISLYAYWTYPVIKGLFSSSIFIPSISNNNYSYFSNSSSLSQISGSTKSAIFLPLKNSGTTSYFHCSGIT